MRNQTRSTKPLLFDLRTEELSQTGHSLILLAKVSCIKIDRPSLPTFSCLAANNYEEGTGLDSGWNGGGVCC
jgi:hypothetical protein